VREGPNPGLHAFLEAMAKLKGALDYFSSNNPGSIELENVRSLHSSGGGQLFREFSEQLKKHSRPVPVIEILNCVAASDSVCGDEVSRASSDAEGSISHLPEEVHTSLALIAEWLCNNERDPRTTLRPSTVCLASCCQWCGSGGSRHSNHLSERSQ